MAIATVKDVLIDLIEDNSRRLHRFMDQMEDDCLYWKPHPKANSIGLTVWHMGRLFDVFLTRQIVNDPAESECWFRNGWMQKGGYDPRGIGREGWGTLNGYTDAEAGAVPQFDKSLLLGYYGDVINMAINYIEQTSIEQLNTIAPGFEAQFTNYQIIQMVMMDNARHLGEIYAIKALWEKS